MRVLFVINSLGPAGAERMLVRLVSGLSPDFDPVVVSLTSKMMLADQLKQAGIDVRTLSMDRPSMLPLALPVLVGWIRSLRPGLVSTWMYHADFVGGVAARLAGNRAVVWNIRNGELSSTGSKWTTRRLVDVNARLSTSIPKSIICCSEAAKELHAGVGYDRSRMQVIPNGFDLKAFAPDPVLALEVRRELQIPSDAFLIGLIARWNPTKNHRGFVEAAAELSRRIPGVHFLMAGYNVTWENAELKRLIDGHGLTSVFRLLGYRQDVHRLNAALDIATSASFAEAFPNILGEAMACGVPCVATDVGDSALIVGDTGFVVPPGNPDAIASAWQRMIELPIADRTSLGLRARERIIRNFELGVVREKYEKAFRTLAQ